MPTRSKVLGIVSAVVTFLFIVGILTMVYVSDYNYRKVRKETFSNQIENILMYFDDEFVPTEEDFDYVDEDTSYTGEASIVSFDEYYEIIYLFVEDGVRFLVDIYVDDWDSRSTTVSYVLISYYDDNNRTAISLSYYDESWLTGDYTNHVIPQRPQTIAGNLALGDIHAIKYFLEQIGYPVE